MTNDRLLRVINEIQVEIIRRKELATLKRNHSRQALYQLHASELGSLMEAIKHHEPFSSLPSSESQ